MIVFFITLLQCSWIISKHNFFKIEGRNIYAIIGWGISLLGGITIWYIYNKVYQIERVNADTFKFFDDAVIIASYFRNYPIDVFRIFSGFYDINNETIKLILESTTHWYRPFHFGEYNDNQLIIRINLIILIFSGGYYPTHLLFFNFSGFLGLWLMIKSNLKRISLKNNFFWIGLFIIPNAWLWISGVLKEPILILFLGLFYWSFFEPQKWKAQKISLFIISVLGLVLIKVYVLICLLPPIIVFSILAKKKFWIKTAVLYSIGILAFILSFLLFDFNPSQVLAQKQLDFNNVAEISKAKSFFETFTLSGNPKSILINAPMALINGVFRPFIWNSKSPFMLISSLENISLFILVIIALFKIKGENFETQNRKNFIVLFSLNLLILIGLTTTVSGALVRYKIPATILLSIFIITTFFKKDDEKQNIEI